MNGLHLNIPRKELKRIARGNLTGHYLVPIQVFIFATIITSAIELPFLMIQTTNATTVQTVTFYLAEFLIALVGSVLTIGQTKMHLSMARKQQYSKNDLFYGFKNHTDHYVLYGLIVTVATYIAMIPYYVAQSLFSMDASGSTILLCIGLALITLILQVIFQVEFELLYFVALENENLTARQVLQKSHAMMKGNRKKLFVLLLSFFGMDLLAMLSMGIGYLWLHPYQMQTMSNFYLALLGELPAEETYTFNQYA